MNKDNNTTYNLNVFLQSVQKFINSRLLNKNMQDIINDGLHTFLNLPYTEAASLYKLDFTSFDFKLDIVIPVDYTKTDELYQLALKEGIIGNSLEMVELYYSSIDSDESSIKNIISIPLTDSSGVIGLILVAQTVSEKELDDEVYQLLAIQGTLISTYLENHKILSEFNQQTSILEQRIAARTIDLSRNRKELETIFNAVQSGVIVTNEETNSIIKINPHACNILKCKEQDILNMKFDDHFENIYNENLELIKDINLSNAFESYAIDTNNNSIPVLRTIQKVRFGDSKFRVESFNDITKLKKAEATLKEANEILEIKVQERTEDLRLLIEKLEREIHEREQAELEVRKLLAKERELSELKSRFVAMISHEFRTPLTIIKSSSQMLTKFDNKLNATDRTSYLHKITKTVDYMTDLIENIIFIGKSDSPSNKVVLEKVNLHEFCRNLIDDFNLTQKIKRNIRLTLSGNDTIVFSDEKLLRLILNNLITNAAKYSEIESPIDINLEISNNYANLSVQDYGIGIPISEQDNIFEIFYRAGNVGNISGTGLGMAVIAESLKLLHGEIELESIVGEGTKFVIKIPR